jgi:mannose-6-phosphate isomerase-like protein (cupin superfamily)
MSETRDAKFLLDPYLDWASAEGVPVIEDFAVDLHEAETGPWPRFGTDGAIVHLHGRGDFVTLFVIDLPPGGASTPQSHLFDEVFFVLSGSGSAAIETQDGSRHTFEWSPNSLFSPPLNSRTRLFNGSGSERARLVVCTDFPILMNIFHNEDFLFENPFRFPEREGKADYFTGDGDFIPLKPGRHMWETKFVPDLANFELKEWEARGAGSSNMKFVLADNVMHAHSSEMPVGSYKKAHWHQPGAHVICITGFGYSILWYEGDEDYVRHPWHHGVVFAPPDRMFHQHFCTSPVPARYLAMSWGSIRYPLMQAKKDLRNNVDVDVSEGGRQINYEDQDPRVHRMFLEELARNRVRSRMGKYFDEAAIMGAAE